MKCIKYCLIGLMLLLSCSDDDTQSTPINQMTDSRDGQVYDIVTIGTQTWFAENLNFDTGDNDSICFFLDETNCFIYGKLYEGTVAQTICPDGWHLPSIEEYQILIDYLGGLEVAHIFLAPFAEQQGEKVGFNLLAGGRFGGDWFDLGDKGYYYTSTVGDFPNSYKILTYDKGNEVTLTGSTSPGIDQSCRCIKD